MARLSSRRVHGLKALFLRRSKAALSDDRLDRRSGSGEGNEARCSRTLRLESWSPSRGWRIAKYHRDRRQQMNYALRVRWSGVSMKPRGGPTYIGSSESAAGPGRYREWIEQYNRKRLHPAAALPDLREPTRRSARRVPAAAAIEAGGATPAPLSVEPQAALNQLSKSRRSSACLPGISALGGNRLDGLRPTSGSVNTRCPIRTKASRVFVSVR